MAIEGFNYEEFAQILSSQAEDLVPPNFQEFQKKYVINTIKNFATLSGEALFNDDKNKFTAEQAMLITQIIAEWSFHKSVDIIKSGIFPEHWDGIMQKVAFTIFEIAKQMIIQNASQEEILQVVEHHVKKTYQTVLEELKERNIIDDNLFDKAAHQSNIDDMMQQIQEEKEIMESGEGQASETQHDSSKILKLASVALLLKQISQDKVKTILTKFDQKDAQAIIQYMQMPDLELKVDKNIAMKCLQEIKTNLPEPKYINPDKILAKIKNLLSKASGAKLEQIAFKERPKVKEFVAMAVNGEYSKMPPKVANIIAQHLEESVL